MNKEKCNCLPSTIKNPLTTGLFVLARCERKETSSLMMDAGRERGSIDRNANQLMTVSTRRSAEYATTELPIAIA